MGRVERLMIKEMITERTEVLDETGAITAQGRPIPVLLYIEPGRFSLPDNDASVQLMNRIFATGVPAGLRATIETGNLLTGAKFISFDYYPERAGEAELEEWLGYPVIPVTGGNFDQIMVKINAILDQVNSAPIEETIANTNAAIAELDEVLKGLGEILNDEGMQNLPANLDATLKELDKTLEGLSPGSELYQNLNASMRQLNRTLDNMESLTRTLSNQPNAAIMPARLPPDPEPEAR
jgi:paraquat-inducible protein B